MLELILGVIQQLGSQPPWLIAWQLFVNGGWVVFIILFFFVGRMAWLNWRQNLYMSKQDFILLAVDIPQAHLQNIKAVEQIFAALWGSFGTGNKKDKWWNGRVQLAYSIELVSIEGYIQFLIHTPAPFRDLVESAIYAQYPDSEIVEVQDYTQSIPKEFPAEGWDLWGTEFSMTKSDVYPIKTYPLFEHMLSAQFVDPLAALLEVLARLGPGEQIWLQWVISPISDSWQDKSHKEVKKLLGVKTEAKKNFLFKILEPLFSQFADILKQGSGLGPVEIGSADASADKSQLAQLSPGERAVVEAIQNKATKIGYETKMRMIYTGAVENFSRARGVAGVIGALRQFSALHLNGFKPNGKTATNADYFRVKKRIEKRQRKILSAFRSRSQTAGAGNGFILNTEELATLWHFPSEEVKAPQVKRSDTKVVEPPSTLPIESPLLPGQGTPGVSIAPEETSDQEERPKVTVPVNKPTVTIEQEPESVTVSIEGRRQSAQPKTSDTTDVPDNLPM